MNIQEIASPIWDYTAPIVVDKSTVKYEFKSIPPDTGDVTKLTESNFTFTTDSTTSDYIFPSDSYLKLDLQITKAGGVAIPSGHNVAMKNNGWSLFRNIRLTIDGKEVENKKKSPGIGSTIMKLLRETPDEIKSTGQAEFFFLEEYENDQGGKLPYIEAHSDVNSPFTGLKYDKANTPTGVANGPGEHSHVITYTQTDLTVNLADRVVHLLRDLDMKKKYGKSFMKRKEISGGSKKFSIKLPLSKIFGLLHDNPIALKGLKLGLDIELNRNPNDIIQAVITDDIDQVYGDEQFELHITRFEWWMPRCKPSLAVSADVQEYFLDPSNTIDLHYNQWEVFDSNKEYDYNHTGQVSFDLPKTLYTPTYLFVVPQLVSRTKGLKSGGDTFPGSHFSDKIFDHVRLKSLYVTLNSQDLPERRYEMNFSNGNKHIDYQRVYKAFIDASFDQKGSEENIISYELFRKHYPIFAFDFTKLDNKVFESQSSNNISVTFEIDGSSIDTDPGNDNDKKAAAKFKFWCVLLTDRFAKIGVADTSMTLIM